jgi:hypothetical protein
MTERSRGRNSLSHTGAALKEWISAGGRKCGAFDNNNEVKLLLLL